MYNENELETKLSTTADKFIRSPIKMIFLTVILLGAIGFGISIINGVFSTTTTVATAPAKIIKRTLQTDNIIQSYEWFYDVNASYTARLAQVNQFQGLLNGEEDAAEKRKLRIDMTAMQQTCRDLATKYNANSKKMNKSIFKGWSLPDLLEMGACG